MDRAHLKELSQLFSQDQGITLAYLFGSHSFGRTSALSDVDIALLLTSTVPSDKYLDYRVKYYQAVARIIRDDKIDIVILNSATCLLAHEAIKGQLLFERSPEARVKYVVDVQRKYLDLKPFYAIDAAYMRRRMEEGRFGQP